MKEGAGARERTAGIALFDLDYTLLGGDATWEWIHFLIGQGALDRSSYEAELEQFYVELGHGQQELSIGHLPVLEAADTQLLVRETIRAVASGYPECQPV